MNNKENVVSTIEELEKFINTHSDCEVHATKELDDKLNRNMSLNLSRPPEDFDLFFRIHNLTNIMTNKGIKYRRVTKMNDNKQIENMALIIEHARDDCDNCEDLLEQCMQCPYNCTEYYGCGALKTATDLYNAGYHKISEGSMVISKDEYEEYLWLKNTTRTQGKRVWINKSK